MTAAAAAATLLRRAQSSHHEWYCTDAMYTLSCLRSYIKNQSSSLSGNAPFQEYNERGFGRERKQREDKRRERCSRFISWGLHTCKIETLKPPGNQRDKCFSHILIYVLNLCTKLQCLLITHVNEFSYSSENSLRPHIQAVYTGHLLSKTFSGHCHDILKRYNI